MFGAQHGDVAILTQLVQELSFRKYARARRLLVLAAKTLGDLESEADAGGAPITFENDAPSQEDANWDSPEYEGAQPTDNDGAINAASPRGRPSNDTIDRDRPPDDRKRPQRLSRVRPLGTPGLPPPWVRPRNAGGPLAMAANADLPQGYAAALAALIAEIKATGAGQKRYELENGIRGEGKESIYEFPFADAADLFEDAMVPISIARMNAGGASTSKRRRQGIALEEALNRTSVCPKTDRHALIAKARRSSEMEGTVLSTVAQSTRNAREPRTSRRTGGVATSTGSQSGIILPAAA